MSGRDMLNLAAAVSGILAFIITVASTQEFKTALGLVGLLACAWMMTVGSDLFLAGRRGYGSAYLLACWVWVAFYAVVLLDGDPLADLWFLGVGGAALFAPYAWQHWRHEQQAAFKTCPVCANEVRRRCNEVPALPAPLHR